MGKVMLLLLSLSWIPGSLRAQVRGISASKIGAYNAQSVPGKTVEFEPEFSTGWSDMIRNGEGKRVRRFSDPDSIERFTSLDFRMTYGITNGFEAGIFLSGDFELLSIGLKKRIFEGTATALSFIAGYNYAAGNGIITLSHRGIESHSSLPLGLSATFNLSPKASIDADIQAEPVIKLGDAMNTIPHYYLDVDAGYYPVPTLQLITGLALNWGTRDFAGPRGYQLTLNPGVTVETGKKFIIVISAPVCIAGRTHYCFRRLELDLTLSFD